MVQLRWIAVKRVPLAQIIRRVEELEERYGGSLTRLHDDFIDGKLPRDEFEDYVEWSGMNHALRAYREGEDFDYYADVDLDLSPKEYRKLTPRRLELMDELILGRYSSINQLASRIGRDVKNVYLDLKALEKLGFIQLIKEGRRLSPELLVQELTIQLG